MASTECLPRQSYSWFGGMSCPTTGRLARQEIPETPSPRRKGYLIYGEKHMVKQERERDKDKDAISSLLAHFSPVEKLIADNGDEKTLSFLCFPNPRAKQT